MGAGAARGCISHVREEVDEVSELWVPKVKPKPDYRMQVYYSDRVACPACDSTEIESTCLGYLPVPGVRFRDENRASCGCGWKGQVDDLVPEGLELEDYLILQAGFCGCGDPDEAAKYLRDLLRVLNSCATLDYRKEMLGNGGQAYWTLYMLDHFGLTEHGSMIYGCWLSTKGKAVLRRLEAQCDRSRTPECE